ncbi:1574_t:CDS:2 [Entrophospora sp. SA101]|nr:1574_t:CDS:2 [Entrophospora sp. SA101]
MAIVSKLSSEGRDLLAVGKLFPPNNPKLDRLVTFLKTVPGTDKALMFIQYFSKILIWFFTRIGKKSLAQRIYNLYSPIADFRILLRIENDESLTYSSPLLLNLRRLQNILMLLYYPLEHTWWLSFHKIIPIPEDLMNKIGVWSCRFWAIYVLVQFSCSYLEWKIVKRKKLELIKSIDFDEKDANSKIRLRKDHERIVREVFTNIGYFPLTLHWSIPNSIFPEIGEGIFGTIAAYYELSGAWKSHS